MSTNLPWTEIGLRLFLSALAGGLIGMNREERGHAAGLRTSILVCLAASFAMIMANLLLNTDGKTAGSFATADVLRMPLGILEGMGFIGAGAIVRRDDLVLGVTTAATLWFVTAMGLCFGSGYLALGSVALGLGLATLWGVKRVETHILRHQHATLELTLTPGPLESQLRTAFESAGYRITPAAVTHEGPERRRQLIWAVHWRARLSFDPPAFLASFADNPGIERISWRPNVVPVVK